MEGMLAAHVVLHLAVHTGCLAIVPDAAVHTLLAAIKTTASFASPSTCKKSQDLQLTRPLPPSFQLSVSSASALSNVGASSTKGHIFLLVSISSHLLAICGLSWGVEADARVIWRSKRLAKLRLLAVRLARLWGLSILLRLRVLPSYRKRGSSVTFAL